MTQQPTMTIPQALELATQHHRAGNVAQAEAIYRQIISAQPNHSDALHQFGVLLFHSRRLPEAIEMLRRAVAANPNAPRYFCNLGAALAAAGQHEPAMGAYRAALALRPDFAEAFYNVGNLLRTLGRTDDAITAYRQALAIAPQTTNAWINLGNLLREKREFEQAISALGRAISLEPNLAEAHHNLANALLDSDRFVEAISEYRQALSLKPDLPGGHSDLANALRRNGNPEESAAEARKAVETQPDDSESFNALGNAMLDLGQTTPAIEAYRAAIALSPDYALAHANLGLALLLTGDFRQGWIEHEWRLRAPELGKFVETFSQPMWEGGGLDGRTILLHAEQAFGDAIQFSRYAALVAQRGGTVLFRCPRELAALMKSLNGPSQVIGRGDAMLAFDLHCPLMSLPRIFETDTVTIPSTMPYLRADPELSARWRTRLPGDSRKIGLVWTGRRSYRNDRNRSMPAEMLAPLAKSSGLTFISLQKGSVNLPFPMLDWTGELNDFADTAALIDNLDLVIAVDTAVAHLSGALGKEVWLMLPFVPDWRWMLGRDDSPWYPTARLFRQPAIGDWETPVQQVLKELERWRK